MGKREGLLAASLFVSFLSFLFSFLFFCLLFPPLSLSLSFRLPSLPFYSVFLSFLLPSVRGIHVLNWMKVKENTNRYSELDVGRRGLTCRQESIFEHRWKAQAILRG